MSEEAAKSSTDIISTDTVLDGQWWIRAAQASIRRFCGWHVAPSLTEKLRIDTYGGKTLLLPSRHVTDLKSVKIDGVEIGDRVAWSHAGTVVLRHGCWPNLPGAVEIELTHGWDVEDVPDIAALIITIGKRARSQPGIISSQSVNGSSVSYQTAGGAPLNIPLLDIEKQALAPFCLNWGS